MIGVELLADYLWENLPCSELQNNGTYFLAVTDTEELSTSELQLRPVLRSHCDGQPGSADESLTLRLHSAHTHRYLFSNALYIASVSPLNLYSRNALSRASTGFSWAPFPRCSSLLSPSG